jgi:H+/Cl- antiporter ClcA
MIALSLIAVPLGGVCALVAVALLKLIALFTNLFFFQRFATDALLPAQNALGWGAMAVPVVGGLLIGLMARFGSDRIRGHGIPEALEAILIRGSRIQPRVAVLKPLSSAISIGSGGPFGAEGPIIMTGGAVGSITAQLLHLTAAERKTLLVAGAAAGMAATFAVPLAAVLLAVELLLFELKPRSLVPVALSSAVATIVRRFLLGPGPLFSLAPHPALPSPTILLACVAAGLAAGTLAVAMTATVYAAEDAFQKLPLHWMWWPALGGVAIGVGGLLCPRALGVGYDQIESLLSGHMAVQAIVVLLLVKWAIWATALGSGTSGGVLAPLLMIGAGLGGLLNFVLPSTMGVGFWPLVTMAATLGGTMRAPLTAVVFAAELTGDFGMLLPLLVAAMTAHGLTVLAMRRSILTEKVARRGHHISREYSIDALELIFVEEVMRRAVTTFTAADTLAKAATVLATDGGAERQRLFPIIDDDGRLVGVVTRRALIGALASDGETAGRPLSTLMQPDPVVAFPDEPLRVVVHRMAARQLTTLPVVERAGPGRLLGKLTLRDALKARVRHLDEEESRERVLKPLAGLGWRRKRGAPAVP